MSDLSHTFDAADEFGGLDHLVPPGQDPQVLRSIYASLMEDLQPKDFLGRLRVRDAAIETARIEYVRQADAAAHGIVQEQSGAAGSGPSSGGDTTGGQVPSRAMGEAFLANLSFFDTMAKLSLHMVKERDRIISEFDMRSGLLKLVKELELELLAAAGDED